MLNICYIYMFKNITYNIFLFHMDLPCLFLYRSYVFQYQTEKTKKWEATKYSAQYAQNSYLPISVHSFTACAFVGPFLHSKSQHKHTYITCLCYPVSIIHMWSCIALNFEAQKKIGSAAFKSSTSMLKTCKCSTNAWKLLHAQCNLYTY